MVGSEKHFSVSLCLSQPVRWNSHRIAWARATAAVVWCPFGRDNFVMAGQGWLTVGLGRTSSPLTPNTFELYSSAVQNMLLQGGLAPLQTCVPAQGCGLWVSHLHAEDIECKWLQLVLSLVMIFTVHASCMMPLNTDCVLLGSSLLWCSPLWAENQSKARGKEKSPSWMDHQSVWFCSLLPPVAKATWIRGRWRKFCNAKFEMKVS